MSYGYGDNANSGHVEREDEESDLRRGKDGLHLGVDQASEEIGDEENHQGVVGFLFQEHIPCLCDGLFHFEALDGIHFLILSSFPAPLGDLLLFLPMAFPFMVSVLVF